jgi:hypothetical protein
MFVFLFRFTTRLGFYDSSTGPLKRIIARGVIPHTQQPMIFPEGDIPLPGFLQEPNPHPYAYLFRVLWIIRAKIPYNQLKTIEHK